MGTADLGRLGRTALPIVAVLSLVVGLFVGLAGAGDTLGFDFLAYHAAATRLLDGQPLYDMSFQQTGGFGLFYYPPTFAPLVLVFGWLTPEVAVRAWTAVLVGASLVAVAILPVSRTVRWWILLLMGLSFPYGYAVKLGQVGPLLLLTMAVGWRWLDEPIRLGASAALGAAIKLQPGLILVWALLTRRFRAVVVGAVVLVVLGAAATLLAGASSWTDFLTLARTVSDPITTPHNFTPGAIGYQLGLSSGTATVLQVASTIAAVVALLAAIRWSVSEASYLAAVIVSQLVSPILWDHYAILLLLPVAYLLAAGRWWALAIPLATAWPIVGLTPAVVYPIVFWISLVATVVVGWRSARVMDPATPRPAAAA